MWFIISKENFSLKSCCVAPQEKTWNIILFIQNKLFENKLTTRSNHWGWESHAWKTSVEPFIEIMYYFFFIIIFILSLLLLSSLRA